MLEDAIATLEPAARDLWPETFAGLWITRQESGEVVNIAFTEDAAENVGTLAQGFPRPEILNAVTLERPIAELESRQDQMIADRGLIRAGTLQLPGIAGENYDLGIDQPSNAIYVVLESPTPETVAAFKSAYGTDVDVRQGAIAQTEIFDDQLDDVDEQVPDASSCSRVDCRYRLRSGLNVACSSAFTVKRLSDGTRFLLSAAHCSGTERFHGGERYGSVVDQQFAGRVDAERHSVTGAFSAKPWIFVDSSEKRRKVRAVATWEGTSLGQRVCMSGVNGGPNCADVTDKHFSPGGSDYPNDANRYIKAKYCGLSGDSGAGVFGGPNDNPHKAFGVHSGGDPGTCQEGPFSIFGHIEYAENALNVRVVKRP